MSLGLKGLILVRDFECSKKKEQYLHVGGPL